MIIRQANESDWADIYPFFRLIVSEGTTYAFPKELSLEDARPWWMERPLGTTAVAVEDSSIVGSAKMGPNRPGRGSNVATASFMVDPIHQGNGVGLALSNYDIDWARAAGYRSIQFNAVVATNAAAVRLWKRLIFSIITTVPNSFDHPEHGLVGLHLMYLEL